MGKTELDVVEFIGQNEEPHERGIQRYDHRRRRRVMANLLKDAHRGRVLDLGCSNGSWYSFFAEQGFDEIHGVELSETRAKLAAAKGYTVFQGRGQDTPYEDGYFDVIVNQDVLVHVLQEEDRKGMIREAQRILKPGGIYIFTFPPKGAEERRKFINKVTGYTALTRLKHRLVHPQGREVRLPTNEYVRFWEATELSAFIASIGLREVEQVGHTFYFGDLSANLPPVQRLLDAALGVRFPLAASVVFVKCTK